MYLFFDTETTGKAKNFNASFKDTDNWPRITQLAWQVYNEDGRLFKSSSSLIKPDGWEIPKEQFFIDNNMSTERCEKEGRPLKDVVVNFILQLDDCKYLIAHNMAFDLNVMACEMHRLSISAENKPIKFCTMKSMTDVMQLPGMYGFKFPSLKELHNYLFKCDFEGAHDAGDDVTATAKCFFELKKQNLITL